MVRKRLVLIAATALSLTGWGALGDIHGRVTPEVRTTYISLGKIVEDRPMQITSAKGNIDLDLLGRLGVSYWGVTSLSDRKEYVHRHFTYFNDIGPYLGRDFELAEGWTLKSELSRQWSLFRGFEPAYHASERTLHWSQLDQELANPYLTPYWRLRKVFKPIDLLYFKAGVRHPFDLGHGFFFTPAVQVEGGDSTNNQRRLGRRPNGRNHPEGIASLTFRLELGWKATQNLTAFAAVDRYDIVSRTGRESVEASRDPCAAKGITVGSVGLRICF